MATYKSKHAIVSRSPYELYMSFVDLRNLVQFLPEDKKKDIQVDADTLRARVQGFDIGVRIIDRKPYSKITVKDDGAPFQFTLNACFDSCNGEQNKTDFYLELEIELNMMMKMFIGSKIQGALDKVVEGMAAMSEGKLPEGVDPSMFPNGVNPFDKKN